MKAGSEADAEARERKFRLDAELRSRIFVSDFELAVQALERGADPNAESDHGVSATMLAASRGAWEILDDMKKAGADFGRASSVTELRGWTPLMAAARRGHSAAIRELIRLGANPDGRGSHGWTPLMAAASEGHVQAAMALLESGAKLSLRRMRTFGETALGIARSRGMDDFAEEVRRFEKALLEREKIGRKIGRKEEAKPRGTRGM